MTDNWYLGVDVGGTNSRAALVSSSGEIHRMERMKTDVDKGLASFVDRLCALCSKVASIPDENDLRLKGIGIGIPGLISNSGKILASPNLKPLEGVSFSELLQEKFDCSVTVVNDADAIAWGEALFGAGSIFDSFITLTLGTGVGGGLVLNRKLWHGSEGFAGEIGHVMVEPEGRPCPCGSKGCLEQYSSASGIVLTFCERCSEKQKGESVSGRLDSKQIAEKAQAGDPIALFAYEEAGRRLGQVLSVVTNLLNLDGAVIAGGASRSLPLLLPGLTEELKLRAFEKPANSLKIVKGALGDKAGILGAAHIHASSG